jgi:MFS family permease
LARFNPSATVLGAIASTYFGGVIVGVIFAHIFADLIGRRRSIQLGGAIGLLGAIIQTCAYNVATFFVGRVFAGIASGIMLPVVNVYQAEIAPPHLRGAMVSMQLIILACAGTTAAFVGFGCYHASNLEFAWYLGSSQLGLTLGAFRSLSRSSLLWD